MDSEAFANEMSARVARYCEGLADRLPSYSYVDLPDDGARAKVMKSRLWNEVRSGEIMGSWLRTTPEMDVKSTMAESVHEEFEHAQILSAVLQDRGDDPWDYRTVPAQVAMFNAFEGLGTTVERMAAFPLAGEGVAVYMIQRGLASNSVPEWVSAPYRAIFADEEGHGSYPASVLAKYAKSDEQQDAVRRAVEMSLVLRQQYFDNLDLWVYEDRAW